MRLTSPATMRRYGQLHVAEEVQILDLDVQTRCGHRGNSSTYVAKGDVCFSRSSLDDILSAMVIVVPCKDEELHVIWGVIAAIPAPCVVLLVSNCRRATTRDNKEGKEGEEEDQYTQLVEMSRTFGAFGRQVLTIHQKDPAAAAALRESGMSQLLDSADKRVTRNGKGEGMVLGIALAEAFYPQKRYIGFVDADNFNPCSVGEYCQAFAAGFAMSRRPEYEDTIVRLKWSSKPKVRTGGTIEFVPEGRCSRIVNAWLNRLFVPSLGGAQPRETARPFITTGNAGEHAMTMALARKLRLAAGYAIEPFHFVDLLVRGCLDGGISMQRLDKPVVVRQVRTLSPHYHRESDDEHIRKMWAAGLGSIYHGLSPYCAEGGPILKLCEDMRAYAVNHNGIDKATGELPCPRIYPPVQTMNIRRFRDVLESSIGKGSFHAFGLSDDVED
ncbi:glycosyltransferase family 55 protein [Parathielavia appendiculata]|uniref:Glycosyltransferase family 55 protein n=1 Tax=Parathielavia appendiculata TaxID=2587402 RepID=A0AAN6TT88_9PEZI|nr:glycosyltransferase family 55 protein [Parathielavia appendiculata]